MDPSKLKHEPSPRKSVSALVDKFELTTTDLATKVNVNSKSQVPSFDVHIVSTDQGAEGFESGVRDIGPFATIAMNEENIRDSATVGSGHEEDSRSSGRIASESISDSEGSFKKGEHNLSPCPSVASSECVSESSSDRHDGDHFAQESSLVPEGGMSLATHVFDLGSTRRWNESEPASTLVVENTTSLRRSNSFDEFAETDDCTKEDTNPVVPYKETELEKEKVEDKSPKMEVVKTAMLHETQVYEMCPDHCDQNPDSPSDFLKENGDVVDERVDNKTHIFQADSISEVAEIVDCTNEEAGTIAIGLSRPKKALVEDNNATGFTVEEGLAYNYDVDSAATREKSFGVRNGEGKSGSMKVEASNRGHHVEQEKELAAHLEPIVTMPDAEEPKVHRAPKLLEQTNGRDASGIALQPLGNRHQVMHGHLHQRGAKVEPVDALESVPKRKVTLLTVLDSLCNDVSKILRVLFRRFVKLSPHVAFMLIEGAKKMHGISRGLTRALIRLLHKAMVILDIAHLLGKSTIQGVSKFGRMIRSFIGVLPLLFVIMRKSIFPLIAKSYYKTVMAAHSVASCTPKTLKIGAMSVRIALDETLLPNEYFFHNLLGVDCDDTGFGFDSLLASTVDMTELRQSIFAAHRAAEDK